MNKIIFSGHIAKITAAQRGDKDFCYMSVAHNNGKDKDGNQRPADFISFEVWGPQASFVKQWCSVGDPVAVEGRLKNNVYEKDGEKTSRLVAVCASIEKLGGKKTDGNAQPTAVESAPDDIDISQDDLPF